MNYEQKYKEALQRVRMILTDRDIALHAKEKFIDIFPELKESEDERIKRTILELVSIAGNGNQFEEIKDWIKLQDEKEILIADQNRMIEELRIQERLTQLQDFNYQMKLKEEEVKNRECFLKKINKL